MSMNERGILYAATGEEAYREALGSARRVREVLPEIPVAIATDSERPGAEGLARIIVLADPYFSCGDKIDGMRQSPFRETLFLDPDTYVAEDPSEVFALLARFPLAVSHAPYRDAFPLVGIPGAFPEMNTGVIGFRSGPEWDDLLAGWDRDYRALKRKADQPAFRKALWEAGIPFCTLPPEYQFRTATHCFAGMGERVRIIHGRHVNPGALAAALNRSKAARVYVKSFGSLWTDEVITESRLHRLLKKVLGRRS